MAVNPNLDPSGITDDPIVNQVIELIVKRHIQGMEKFGKTMEANERPINEWVDETIEELLDAIHYLTKTKTIFDKFKSDNKRLKSALEVFEKGSFVDDKNTEEKKD
jgi:hypothetical protein